MVAYQEKDCPFCSIFNNDVTNRILAQNDFAFVIRDGYPVSEGHTLIIPKRHIGSFLSNRGRTTFYSK